MKLTTLCLAIKDGKVLLAMKKRGFGMGKWNGCGGKVEEGEEIPIAAAREMREEVGLFAEPANISKVGDIKFHFLDNPGWNQHMHVFLVKDWQGEAQESEEMKPQWFDVKDIPFDAMWPDDKHWLPMVLAGKKIEGRFDFVNEGAQIDGYDIREI
mgnify:CR=1 FL=1